MVKANFYINQSNITSKQVFSLRREGQLQEAYAMALQLMQTQQEDIWSQRAMFYVLEYILKDIAINKEHSMFLADKEHLIQEFEYIYNIIEKDEYVLKTYNNYKNINSTAIDTQANNNLIDKDYQQAIEQNYLLLSNNPNNQNLINSIGWDIYHYLKQLYTQNNTDSKLYSNIISRYLGLIQYNLQIPSLLHSCMLRIVCSLAKAKLYNMTYFFSCFNNNNFQENDFTLSSEVNTNSHAQSLAEKVYMQIGRELKDYLSQNYIDSNYINYVINLMNEACSYYPDNIWFHYYKAKACISIKDITEAKEQVIYVLKYKNTEAWAWTLAGDMFMQANDIDLAISCYARGCLCKGEENFKLNNRVKLAICFEQKQMFTRAKYEANYIIQYKQEHEQKIPAEIISLCNQNWYEQSTIEENNYNFYTQLAQSANNFFEENLTSFTQVILGYSYNNAYDKAIRILYLADEHNTYYAVKTYNVNILSQFKAGSIVDIKGTLHNNNLSIKHVNLANTQNNSALIKDIAAVTYVLNDKNKAFWSAGGKKEGFYIHNNSELPKLGQHLQITAIYLNDHYETIEAKPTDKDLKENILKEIHGAKITYILNNNDIICYLDNNSYYCSYALIKKFCNQTVKVNDYISGICILGYDHKKNKDSYKFIKITSYNPT